MSGIYILKNVYNFAQVLNLACSKQLQKWDESTLQKALKWAQYCEEIYNHVLNQGYAQDINTKIIQMNALLTPPSLLMLDFDCLRIATKIVVESILTNSYASYDLKNHLENYVDPTLWSEVSEKMKARPPINESFSIFWIQNQTELLIVKDRNTLTYARILLKNIMSIVEASENDQRVQQYFVSLFDLLVSFERGWELLVQFFVVSPESLPSDMESTRKSVMSIVLSWMNVKMQDIAKCPILELNVDVLKQASVKNSDFLSLYLSSLEKWGHSFQPCFDNSANELWRDSNNDGASHLSKHFRHLLLNDSNDCPYLDVSQGMKTEVLRSLTSNINKSDFTVWRTVASKLLGS